MSQQTYYYEIEGNIVSLLVEGGTIHQFLNVREMYFFVDDQSALFIEVTPYNWDQLYEQGAFF